MSKALAACGETLWNVGGTRGVPSIALSSACFKREWGEWATTRSAGVSPFANCPKPLPSLYFWFVAGPKRDAGPLLLFALAVPLLCDHSVVTMIEFDSGRYYPMYRDGSVFGAMSRIAVLSILHVFRSQ